MSTPSFGGHWRVTDCIFEPNGIFSGLVHQIRTIQLVGENRVQVNLKNEVGATLRGHPMGAFDGEWTFDLAQAGAESRYLGPDTLGNGLILPQSGLWGELHWPRLNHSVFGFGAMATPWRLLTSTLFYNVDSRDAVGRSFGISMPQSELGDTWPVPQIEAQANEISRIWRGKLCTYTADGTLIAEKPLRRTYHDDGWTDSLSATTPYQQARGSGQSRWLDAGSAAGRMTLYGGIGASARLIDTQSGEYRAEYIEIFDVGAGVLIWVRRWFAPTDNIHHEWAQLKISPN